MNADRLLNLILNAAKLPVDDIKLRVKVKHPDENRFSELRIIGCSVKSPGHITIDCETLSE